MTPPTGQSNSMPSHFEAVAGVPTAPPGVVKERGPRRTSIRFFLLLCLVLLTACGQTAENESAPTPTPLPTPVVPEQPRYTVERGTVVKSLTFTGRVSPVTEQSLFFRSDGFVDRVLVARGDTVQAGDLLAELDVTTLEAQLAQAELALERAQTILNKAEEDHEDALAEAQLQLEQAQARLQQAQAGAGGADVTTAEVNLRRAEEQLAYWEEEYAKAQDRPWEPQEELDNYAYQVHQAEQNLEIAQAQYDAARGNQSATYYEVQLRQYDVQLAELQVQQLERGIDPLLALDVEKARLDVADLEAKIEQAQLVAPFPGRVTSLNVQPGDAVQAYDAVAVVADPAALEVTAELGSDALREISVSMTATVQLRNRPETTLTGTVRQLPAGVGSSTDDGEDTRIHVTLDAGDVPLEIGELANVTIVLREKENVLWLPPAAIRTFQGRDFVVVEEEDGQRRVDVRLGIASESRVEILEGVTEGQTVVGE